MRRFEDYVDMALPLQECFNVWVLLNAYPHFPGRSPAGEEANLLLRKRAVEWDIAANSTESEKIIWWHLQEDSMDYSGIVTFRHIHHNKQTRVILTMTWNTQMDGRTSFMLDASAGSALRNCLENFEKAALKTQRYNHLLKTAV
jgi:hypothetical protein